MNKCIIQFWEESEIKIEVKSDGCSLHMDNIERVKFIKEIYRKIFPLNYSFLNFVIINDDEILSFN